MNVSAQDWGRVARAVPVTTMMALLGGSALHVILAIALLGLNGPPAPYQAPWWLLGVVFLAAELLVFRIRVGDRSQISTSSDLPLVIALAFASPSAIAIARIASTGVAIARHDSRHRGNLWTEAISPTLETAAAVAVYQIILSGGSPAAPIGWIGGLAAVVVARVIRALVQAGARPRPLPDGAKADRSKLLLVSGLLTLAGAAGGSASIMTVWSDPYAGWLVAALAGPAYVALWGFGNLGRRYEDLNAVFEFTRAIGGPRSINDSITAILTEIRRLFGVEMACVAVALDAPGEAEILALDPVSDVIRHQPVPHGRLTSALNTLTRDGEGNVLDAGSLPPLSAATHTVLQSGLAATISRDGRPVGFLVAGNRVGRRALGAHQAKLFGAIVKHASLTLERSRLIERLTVEIADRRHEALHDSLTDLPNRSFFTAEVDKALAEPGPTVAVLFVDLDHFKDVNDTLGHDQGDSLLREVASRLVSSVRPADFIARLGGDEFAVLIRVGSVADAIGIARRIEESLRRPFQQSGIPIEVGASIGIALADGDIRRASTMLQHADIAMYTAKRAGTVYEIYSPDQQHYSPGRLALAGELRAAIGGGELDVYFQPQVDIATERVVGVEALARWTHPVRGPISPVEFIAIAEKTGLIRLLTARVLRASLQAAARWGEEGKPLRVSVNLSPRILHDSGFTSTVADLLKLTGIDPSMLAVEVTESTVMHDAPKSRAALEQLNDLGVSISIDDFGTGYSSLSALRELPLQELKVDRSFVMAMDSDPGAAAIVSSTIALAHRLGMRVVAEGVETEHTLHLLAEMGCDIAQGFYHARPMPESHLMKWLDEWGSRSADGSVVPLRSDARARRRLSGT